MSSASSGESKAESCCGSGCGCGADNAQFDGKGARADRRAIRIREAAADQLGAGDQLAHAERERARRCPGIRRGREDVRIGAAGGEYVEEGRALEPRAGVLDRQQAGTEFKKRGLARVELTDAGAQCVHGASLNRHELLDELRGVDARDKPDARADAAHVRCLPTVPPPRQAPLSAVTRPARP